MAENLRERKGPLTPSAHPPWASMSLRWVLANLSWSPFADSEGDGLGDYAGGLEPDAGVGHGK